MGKSLAFISGFISLDTFGIIEGRFVFRGLLWEGVLNIPRFLSVGVGCFFES